MDVKVEEKGKKRENFERKFGNVYPFLDGLDVFKPK